MERRSLRSSIPSVLSLLYQVVSEKMLPSTSRLCSKEFLKRFAQRNISKTASTPNSDAISRQQTNELNLKERTAQKKWIRQNKFNNNRALSTLQTKIKPSATPMAFVTKDESREFMAVFPDIVRDLTDAGRHTDIPEGTKRYAKALQYCVPTGKKTRGLAVVATYKMIEKPENLTPEDIRLANIMGWCVEMLQASLIVIDDVMDNSETRRGAPCWYKKETVGLSAINDALMLENGVYSILRRYFKDHPCYVPTVELFHDVTLKTSIGQALDSLCNKGGKPNIDLFSMDRYNAIVKYKTAYYTFQLPVALGMYLCKMFDTEMHRQAKTILMEIGHFFQVQDDFLDCFGDPSVTGKVGTDIQDGKCSWLAVVALQRATPAQKELMKEYYGKSDPEAVKIIRNLYEELSLPTTYAIYEEETFNLIRTQIQQTTKGLPHDLFFKIMDKLYKRES